MFNAEAGNNLLRAEALESVFSIMWMSGFITRADDTSEQEEEAKFFDDATRRYHRAVSTEIHTHINFYFSSWAWCRGLLRQPRQANPRQTLFFFGSYSVLPSPPPPFRPSTHRQTHSEPCSVSFSLPLFLHCNCGLVGFLFRKLAGPFDGSGKFSLRILLVFLELFNVDSLSAWA
jgi:hypothetical protein